VGREGDNEASQEDLNSEDDDSDDGDLDDLANKSFIEDQRISQKHAKHTDLEERAREDMDFPDEVDTPFKEARKHYDKYRGIKSLKNCDWDPYEMLPPEYSKIWRFSNYNMAQKDSVT